MTLANYDDLGEFENRETQHSKAGLYFTATMDIKAMRTKVDTGVEGTV